MSDFGVDANDHRVVRCAQHGIAGLVATRLRARLRLQEARFGGVQRGLAPVQFGLADKALALQFLEAPVIGALLVAVYLGRVESGRRTFRCQPIVLRIDRGERLTGLHGVAHLGQPLCHTARDLETSARFNARAHLARELGQGGRCFGHHRERPHGADILGCIRGPLAGSDERDRGDGKSKGAHGRTSK